MRIFKIIYCVLTAILCVSCSKSPSQEQELPTMDFTFDMPQVKTIVDESNLHTTGSQITLFDVHSRTSPSEEDQSEAGLVQYIDGKKLTFNGSNWDFDSKIPWTKRGTHEFIAYYSKNAVDGSSVDGVSVTYESTVDGASLQTLYVASKATPWKLTLDNQFDFMYATAYRDLIHQDYSSVQLPFKHLFAAVRFRIVNTGTQTRTLNSFTIKGMADRGNAEIWTSGSPSITVTSSGDQMKVTETKALAANGGSVYVHAGTGKVAEDGYFLMWPHTKAYYDNIKFDLKLSDMNRTDMDLSDLSSVNNWQSGYRYTYNINVGDNFITFESVDVVEWIVDDLILEER